MTDQVVSALMRHPVVEIDPDAEVDFVLDLARSVGIHHFPLVRGGTLVGMVCTCDLDDALPQTHVRELARRDVVTVASDEKLRDAVQTMLKETVGSVVVMQGTTMCGMLTREDILRGAPELAQLFGEQHCSACGAAKHLRPGASGVLLCAACAGRAHNAGWLDVGGRG